MAKRYTINDIVGVKDSYKASPGASTGIGQLVFALYTAGSFNMGQCTSGANLIPWGICCNFNCNVNSACTNSTCVTGGFSMGSGTFVALGSMGGCGASLWRRIA